MTPEPSVVRRALVAHALVHHGEVRILPPPVPIAGLPAPGESEEALAGIALAARIVNLPLLVGCLKGPGP